MPVCRTLPLDARPALSPDSTSTHPARRADPRGALDALRHGDGRPGDRQCEAAGRRKGRHSLRMHRNLERSREPDFSHPPHPPPDVMTKDDSRGRTQGPRPCRRSTAPAAPGVRGIVVGRRSPSAAHPRRPHRAEPLHDAERPSAITRRGAGAGTGDAGARPGDAGSSVKRCHTDPALRPSGTGRRGVPQGRGRRGSCRRRRAGARGRSRRGRVPWVRRGRCR